MHNKENEIISSPILDNIKFDQTNHILEYLVKMSQKNQNRKLKISIEGNIASGKSTLINYLKKKIDFSNSNLVFKSQFNLNIIPEPVNLWKNLNGNNLLDLMYNDLQKWAFPFNVYNQLTMLQNHIKCIEDLNNDASNKDKYNIGIMERSLHCSRLCFVENFKKSNIIHQAEYDILDKWYNWIIENHDCELDVIFYLRTNPETCLKRVMKRARPEEVNSVNLDYLQDLHNFHENWLINQNSNSGIYKPASIIVIDANKSVDEVYRTIEIETRNAVLLIN